MQITITSTLTEEELLALGKKPVPIVAFMTDSEALTLAKEKGYSEIDYQIVDATVMPIVTTQVPNPQSPFDFLKAVYENLIKEDAKRLFIAYDDRINIDKKIAREQLLKDMVDAAFVN